MYQLRLPYLLAFLVGFNGLGICYAYTSPKYYNPKDYKQCISSIPLFERKYKIPTNLLHAISIVESGKWNGQLKKLAPWPWTLNIDGKSRYFFSKRDALKGLQEAIDSGAKSIDIGCGQINMKFHGHEVGGPHNLLTPMKNIRYAAQLLAKHYSKTKSWVEAVARYHSSNQKLGKRYALKVKRVWDQLNKLDKLPNKKYTDNIIVYAPNKGVTNKLIK